MPRGSARMYPVYPAAAVLSWAVRQEPPIPWISMATSVHHVQQESDGVGGQMYGSTGVQPDTESLHGRS